MGHMLTKYYYPAYLGPHAEIEDALPHRARWGVHLVRVKVVRVRLMVGRAPGNGEG